MTIEEHADQLRASGKDPVEPYWAEARIEQLESDIAALKDFVCRELTVIEARCDHKRLEHKTASELTSLYLDVKAWARREP